MELRDTRNDRRLAKRRPARTSVRFECRRGTLGLGPSILVRVVDLSQTGACLSLKSAVSLKDEIEVSFDGHDVGPMKRTGIIVWIRRLDDGTVLVGVDFQKALSFTEVQAVAKSL